jgi:hypothetical protein
MPPAQAKAGAVIAILTATGYGPSASATAVTATPFAPADVLERLRHA